MASGAGVAAGAGAPVADFAVALAALPCALVLALAGLACDGLELAKSALVQ
jgi:hypothetical protein